MAWVFLLLTAAIDATWITLLKLHGLRFGWLSFLIVAGAAAAPFVLNHALKVLPLGTSYVVLVGLISVGAVVGGIVFLGESISWPRLLFLGLIIAGIIGLRLLETPAAG